MNSVLAAAAFCCQRSAHLVLQSWTTSTSDRSTPTHERCTRFPPPSSNAVPNVAALGHTRDLTLDNCSTKRLARQPRCAAGIGHREYTGPMRLHGSGVANATAQANHPAFQVKEDRPPMRPSPWYQRTRLFATSSPTSCPCTATHVLLGWLTCG